MMLFGPPECPYCPGCRHWPQSCNGSPEAIERERKAFLAAIENIKPAERRPFFTALPTAKSEP